MPADLTGLVLNLSGLTCPSPARAVALTSVLVAYQREIGYPGAKAHAERVEAIRRRVEGNG